MMRRLLHTLLFALAAIMTGALTSCRQEICYDHFPRMEVKFDWEHEWERDYGMNHFASWDSAYHGVGYHELKPGMPEWVNFVRYDADGYSYESYFKPNGGSFSTTQNSSASYLFYNGDTEYIVFSDMDTPPAAHASATRRSRSSIQGVMALHPNSRSANPPDALYGAFIETAPSGVNHQTTAIPVKMQPLVYTYVIRYEIEEGLEKVSLARGALGGMAESVYLMDGSTSDETIILLFDCELTSYGSVAHVRSFGVPGFPDEYYGQKRTRDEGRIYTLNIELMLKNGKMLSFDFDVTDQLKSQPRGGVIKVDGITIPDDISTPSVDSGFSVEVSGWGNHEDIELPVGVDKNNQDK